MVLLTTTPKILEAISYLPSEIKDDRPVACSAKTPALPESLSDPVSHRALLYISQTLRQTHKYDDSLYTLNQLLRGTKPYVEFSSPQPKQEKTPEFVALMAKLRADEERRQYAALLAKEEAEARRIAEEDEMQGSDDISPSLVLNILISIVMCAGAVFYLTRWWPNDGVRVLLSLGVAIVVGIAEAVVYAAYLRKVNESRVKERKTRERKETIGVFGEGEDVAKIEVWGKGINGGVRKRVKDKYEKSKAEIDK